MSIQTIILQHDGWSYIKRGYQMRSYAAENLIVNGSKNVAMECSGNREWWMFEGVVESLAIPRAATNKLVSYALKEEYRDTTTFPRELGYGAFEFDNDASEWLPVESGAVYRIDFYLPVYERVEHEPELIEFVIVDRNCAPLERPADVNIEFPASLREHPETWYNHPVSISGKSLFLRATALLRSEVARRPADFSMSDFANIGTFTLYRVMHHKPTEYTYHVGKKAKRASRTETKVEILKISSPDSSYRQDAVVPTTISASNWAELEPKIDLFLDTIRAYIAPGHVRLCPHCDGEGFLIGATQ